MITSRPPFTPRAPRPEGAIGNRERGLLTGAIIAIIAIVSVATTSVAGRDYRYAKVWDERVVLLVRFVEEARGHRFKHPVHVRFLTAAEYRAEATGDSDGLEPDEKDYYDDRTALFRTLGLLDASVDLAEEEAELADSGTLAFYRPDDKTVYVRGTKLTPSLKLTLVHELTHALQDQVFGLDPGRFATDGEAFALRAVAEGDAMRIEEDYYASLSAAEQESIDEQNERDVAESSAISDSKAPALLAYFGAPYALGAPFVQLVGATPQGIDRPWRKRAQSEEQILDPFAYLGSDEPEQLRPLPHPAGSTPIYSQGDTLGAIGWYVMLAARLDQRKALRAAEGWAADAMTLYEDDEGVTCAKLAFRGDRASDTDEMAEALVALARTMPQNKPEVTNTGGLAQIALCDPGRAATVPDIDGNRLFSVPAFRSWTAAWALREGGDTDKARCVASGALERFDAGDIASIFKESDGPAAERYRTERATLLANC